MIPIFYCIFRRISTAIFYSIRSVTYVFFYKNDLSGKNGKGVPVADISAL